MRGIRFRRPRDPRLASPTQRNNAVNIVIPADTPPCGYHLYIAVTAVSPQGPRSTYSVDADVLTEYYTYVENISGTVSPNVETFFAVQRLEVL